MSATQNKPAEVEADNPEMAEAIFDHAREQKEQEKEEQTKAARDKQAILNAVKSETVEIRLYGTRIEMRVLTGAEEDWLEETMGQFADYDDEDELSGEDYQAYQDAKSRLLDILIDHSVADEYDREFWKQIPTAKRQQVLGDVMNGGINADRAGN